MPALGIDTATGTCSLALGDGDSFKGELQIDAGKSHLELLLPGIYRLLEEHGLDIGDVDAIAAGTGPGTFSGLRVGIATARGLAQALSVPVAGASTLKALAQGMASGQKSGEAELLPLVDARRGQVFTQLFRMANGEEVTPASDVMCLYPDALTDRLGDMAGRRFLAAGNGAVAYYPVFEAATGVEVLPLNDSRHQVRAAFHLSALTGRRRPRPQDVLAVTPAYIREPDADKTVLLRKREPWQ